MRLWNRTGHEVLDIEVTSIHGMGEFEKHTPAAKMSQSSHLTYFMMTKRVNSRRPMKPIAMTTVETQIAMILGAFESASIVKRHGLSR